MNEQDKQEIEKLKKLKQEYLETKDLSEEEKIKRFMACMRGDKNYGTRYSCKSSKI